MKSREGKFAVSAMSLAVRGALLAMCVAPVAVLADDAANEDLNALIKPTNTVEIGGLYVPKDASKFGEYNGLDSHGGYLIGNFNLRGGDSYGMGEGTRRWEVYGTDLGTTSRSLGAGGGDQGRWSLSVDFDQLRHFTTGGTYQTPYQGSMGGNTFVIPSTTFGVINTTGEGARGLTQNQLDQFTTQDVYSERKDTSVKVGYIVDPQWSVKFDFNRLDQSGAKLIGSGTDTYAGGPNGLSYGGERIAILMNPTEYQTDTINLALNWKGEKGHVSAAYFGSYFHDDYRGVSFSNPWIAAGGATGDRSFAAAFPMSTMSTPPSNDFHQLNLTGGYNFSADTKLVGGVSYGRNTQNESFDGTYTATPNTVTSLPVSSLDGLVVTTHADARLTHQATHDLGLTASFKYNERDNRTPSNTYVFLDEGGVSQTVVNTPMSNRHYQLELAGDYRISTAQRLHVGYEHEHTARWCDNALANNARGAGSAAYYTVNSCAQVPVSKEDKLSAVYKIRATETIDFNAGYAISRRQSDVNSSFYNPMQGNSQGYENYGYVAFFEASRRENMVKTGVNWQATEKFSVGVNGRYVRDDYDSALGVQDGNAVSANLDATYAFSENYVVSAYTSWQRRKRDLLSANSRNAVAPLPNLWTNNLTDQDNTAGISAKQKGFMGGKLEFSEDLTYSLAKSRYSTAGVTSYAAALAVGATGSTPDILTELTQLRLAGNYQLSHVSKVIMGYTFQHLNSNDYMYNGLQYGYTATSMLPSNQQAPNYIINTIYAAYQYSFR